MARLLLLSILFATFLIPVATARVRDPRRAFGLLLTWVLMAHVGYAIFLYAIYPRLL